MTRPWLTWVWLALAATAGCHERVDCAEEPDYRHCFRDDGGGLDGGHDGGLDGGPDAMPDSGGDAGPCGMECPAATPVCGASSGDCVECLGADDCSAPTSMCDTTSNACVACLGAGDCTDPTAARCDAGSCVGCTDSAQCTGIAGTEACDTTATTCVECVDTGDCDGTDTCDLLAQACVDVPLTSLRTCEACTNDEQCPNLHRCVPMQFMGADRDPAYYCLLELDAPGDCPEPFTVGTPERVSLNGAAMERYCAVDEDTVTCEAVRGLLDNWRCDAGVDGRCFPPGEPGMAIDIDGARCEDLDGGAVTNRCTYSCAMASRCPLASTCGDGGTGEANYCGG